MQYEIEVFNLKFMKTLSLKYFGKNLFLMGAKIQVLNQFEFSKGFLISLKF